MRTKYTNFILTHTPKVLTQIDRDENSPTFGSCDRNFWHLKIRDFSSAILQQSGLTLALLYTMDFEKNIYYKNENIFKWAVGTLKFWQSIQLRDGSFNEYYPNEHGFPPTAFTLFSTAETYKILKLEDESLVDSMRKTAKYLVRNIERQAFNQEIASIAGLYAYYTITQEKWVLDGMSKKLDRVLENQSSEGWFPEYGGVDFGYLSVAFDMLAEYYWLSKEQKVVENLKKVPEFLKFFCHPDGTIGGEYGSRNTMYFLPNGLEVLINLNNESATLIRANIYKNADLNNYFQNSIDDRYFSHYVLHSFLRALSKFEYNESINTSARLPCEISHSKFFSEAKLFTFKNEEYYTVIGLNKGGIIKVFNNNEEIFTDFGYRIIKSKYQISTTNWLDKSYEIKALADNRVEVTGKFNLIKMQVSSPIKHLILRVVSMIFGKSIIGLLKKKLIFIEKNIDVDFKRTIELEENSIIISDFIKSNNVIDNLFSATSLSLRHVASGKFFKTTELLNNERINASNFKELQVIQKFDLDTKKISLSIEKTQEV